MGTGVLHMGRGMGLLPLLFALWIYGALGMASYLHGILGMG